MNPLGCALGELCKVLLPIPEEVYFGNAGSPVAVCTLSSIRLLREIAGSDMMGEVAVAGRLLSENAGIDALIRTVNSSPNIRTIILCGREVQGHLAGDALLKLHANGVDKSGRIIGSHSPDPVLKAGGAEIRQFCDNVEIMDHTGETGLAAIAELVGSQ